MKWLINLKQAAHFAVVNFLRSQECSLSDLNTPGEDRANAQVIREALKALASMAPFGYVMTLDCQGEGTLEGSISWKIEKLKEAEKEADPPVVPVVTDPPPAPIAAVVADPPAAETATPASDTQVASDAPAQP